MAGEGTTISTPVGRIVWGNPAVAQKKTDQRTKQPVLRDGQPVEQWAFGVAYTKADFLAVIWPAMAAEATKGFPNGVPSNFSWKYKDGDTVDSKGQPYSKREGYAGCFVLTISTELMAPPIFKLENGSYRQLAANEIKTGDYVALNLNIKVNVASGTNTSSLYINPNGIELVGYGTPIFNAPDAQTMFGGVQHQLPPGATATPQQSAGAPGMPGMPQPGQPPMQPGYPPQQPGYQQPPAQPGYPPQQPGYPPQQPMPGGYAPQPGQPPAQPGYAPPAQPGYPPQTPPMQPGTMPPPHTGFANGTPGQPPMQPGYPPQQPGAMPGQPPAQPGGYPMPGQMPGQMPGR